MRIYETAEATRMANAVRKDTAAPRLKDLAAPILQLVSRTNPKTAPDKVTNNG